MKHPELHPDVSYKDLVEQTLSQDEAIPEKIDKLLRFFEETGLPYEKINSDHLKGTTLHEIEQSAKRAYPNDQFQNIPGAHNISKWIQAVKEIHSMERRGMGHVPAIRQATAGWAITETFDFLNWMRFYTEGAQAKYKFAQMWYEGNSPGYFLPVKHSPQEQRVQVDLDNADDPPAMTPNQKKQIIERHRNKVISRLDSTEKLLRSEEGQLFAGKELEALLDTIYQLKKKLQMVNKMSLGTRLYQDMIVREANILIKKGFSDAGELLSALAQANNPPPANLGTDEPTADLTATPAPPPNQGGGSAGGLPSMGPGMPQNPPESAPNETSPGISAFLENMETGNIGVTKDELKVDDAAFLDISELVSFAQQAPDAPQREKPLEVDEKQLGEKPTKSDDFDHIVDSAFSNVKVQDIINKLENISKIFKTREIPRQLSIADMMMDSLGLAAYFPELSEAINKSLDSNNYIATRIDTVLSKLQGGVEGKSIDLSGNQVHSTSESEALKAKLQELEAKKNLLKKKKEEQDLTVSDKENPEVNIQEDLSQTPPAVKPANPAV